MVGESGRSQIARLTRFHANNANPKELDSLLDWILAIVERAQNRDGVHNRLVAST